MGKSTHPFVLKMNNAKAFKRALRAGETKGDSEVKDEAKSLEDSTEDRTKAEIASESKKRYLTLDRKGATSVKPPKGVLSIVLPK
jgi:hypothetical protein